MKLPLKVRNWKLSEELAAERGVGCVKLSEELAV